MRLHWQSRKTRVPSIAQTWKHVWLTQRAKDWASTKEMLWIGLIGTCCLFMVSCLEDCTVYSIFWCIGHHSFEFSLFAILSFCFEFFPVRSSSARNEETHEFYTEGWIERWVTWASCKGIHRYWSNLISLLISIARGQRMKSAPPPGRPAKPFPRLSCCLPLFLDFHIIWIEAHLAMGWDCQKKDKWCIYTIPSLVEANLRIHLPLIQTQACNSQ